MCLRRSPSHKPIENEALQPTTAPSAAQTTVVHDTIPAPIRTPTAARMTPVGTTRLVPSSEPSSAATKHAGGMNALCERSASAISERSNIEVILSKVDALFRHIGWC